MKLTTSLLLVSLAAGLPFLQYTPSIHAQAQLPAAGPANSSADRIRTNADEPLRVVRDRVLAGSSLSTDARLDRISGRVKVLNAHTLAFDDGTEVELNGGMDAPDLEQKGLIGDAFYPCGKESADFLRRMIADQKVTCFIFGKRGNKVRGDCFIQETNIEIEMVRNGWAVAHHEGMEAWAAIARENNRGLWRGKFVAPERWRRGERLPGE